MRGEAIVKRSAATLITSRRILYYFKTGTSSIYLFNLEKMEFVAESLKYKGTYPGHPKYFNTVQLSGKDEIYMIGGLLESKNPNEYNLLPHCKMIDANLIITEKAMMKTPRCSMSIAVIKDRWILAIGGCIAKNKPCV